MDNGDPIKIVYDMNTDGVTRFHLVLQEFGEDFNVALCGTEVVVEDPDHHFMSDRHELTDQTLCWECCAAFGRIGKQEWGRTR